MHTYDDCNFNEIMKKMKNNCKLPFLIDDGNTTNICSNFEEGLEALQAFISGTHCQKSCSEVE